MISMVYLWPKLRVQRWVMEVQAMVWTSTNNPKPLAQVVGFMVRKLAFEPNLVSFSNNGSNGRLDDGLQILPGLLPAPLNHLIP